MTLAARVTGRHVALDRIAPVVTLEAGGKAMTLAMERTPAGYELRIPALEGSFTYAVTAGPAHSRDYKVTALFPPRVQRIELHYDYPSFTGLKPRDEHDGGDVYGPAGTRVRLVVHADKPIVQGKLAFSEGRPAVALSAARGACARVDADGQGGSPPTALRWWTRTASAPKAPNTSSASWTTVRRSSTSCGPSGDQQITPLDEVPIEARADDDFGIASLDMVYSVSGGARKGRAVHVARRHRAGAHRIAHARRGRSEGQAGRRDRLLRAGARCRRARSSRRSPRSEIFFLEVKPFNEEYSLAQSQAMDGGGDGARSSKG